MVSAHQRKDSCKICGKHCAGEFCQYHKEALGRLKEHFEVWRVRKGLMWEEYLREVANNDLSGEWIKEVAEHLLRGSQ